MAGESPPPPEENDDPFFPFQGVEDFLLAHHIFSKIQMSAGDVDYLMLLWDAYNQRFADDPDLEPPFGKAPDLLDSIDSLPYGDIPWEGFKVQYSGDVPANPPSWMTASYDVWFRNPLDVMEAQLGNPEFAEHIDWAAKQVKDENEKRQYIDLMSGEWAWEQSVRRLTFSFPIITA